MLGRRSTGVAFVAVGTAVLLALEGRAASPVGQARTAATMGPVASQLALVTDSPSGGFDLVTVDEQGSNVRVLASLAPYNYLRPRWSPDGRHIAVYSERTRGDPDNWGDPNGGGLISDLVVVELDSPDAQTTVAHNATSIDPPDPASWSPDSSRLVFTSQRGTSAVPSIRLASPRGGRTVLLRRCALEPAWSPDGRSIAYTAWPQSIAPQTCRGIGNGIRTVSPGGTHERRLTTAGDTPSWSPDGTAIAYVRSGDIWLMHADGTRQHRLTRTPMRESEPVWSPDGRTLAYVRDERGQSGSHIFTIPAAGGSARQRTRAPGFDSEISWSPDGRTIAFSRGSAIVSLNLATGTERTLIEGTDPAWNPLVP